MVNNDLKFNYYSSIVRYFYNYRSNIERKNYKQQFFTKK